MTQWLTYAREHIGTSYEEMNGPIKIQGERRGEFLRPVALSPAEQDGMFGNHWVNFYEMGAVFYSAAKLLDNYGLIEFMKAQRDMYATTSQTVLSSAIGPLYSPGLADGHLLIPSVQHERLLHIFNQKRLNAERFVTTNLRHAIELCLKALAAVANGRFGSQRTFPWGHDLGLLYDDLPKGLQDEIEAEVPKFANAYSQYAEKIEVARKGILSSSVQSKTLLEAWNNTRATLNPIIADLNAGGYTLASSNAVGWNVGAGAEQLIQALNKGPSFHEHRYGPEAGPDKYPTKWVQGALVTGQFFYEHLFPVPLISRSDDGSGPLSEMRGPL